MRHLVSSSSIISGRRSSTIGPRISTIASMVLKRLPRKRIVAAIGEPCRALAILGWASTAPASERGIDHVRLPHHSVFDANTMAPGDIQIVLVEEPISFTQAQRSQGDVGRRRRQLG